MGVLTYIILLIFALYFYLERTVFIDISFHLFYILKDDSFAIQNYRFAAAFTQLFPLIGSKMGLGLDNIAKLYSIGFGVFYFMIFTFIAYGLKLWRYAIIMLLFSTMMISHTFYWIQSELPQGLALMILYFALLDMISKQEKKSAMWYLPLSALLFAVAYSHPLILFPFAFYSLFLIIHDSESKRLLIFSLISFLLFWGIKSVFFKTSYDSSSISGAGNFIQLFPNYFNLESNKDFVRYCISDYNVMILVWMALLMLYIFKKEWIKLTLVGGFFVGYFMLVNISYFDGADQFYMENLYLPLGLITAVPLVWDGSRFLGDNKFMWVIGIIVTIGLLRIYNTADEYTERLSYLNKLMIEYLEADVDKVIIDENLVDMNTLKMSWGTPYEFWLLSTIKYGESISIAIVPNASQYHWALEYQERFFTQWGSFEYSILNPQYFKFTSEKGYEIKMPQ
jgi:hypothetical protein